MTAPFMIVMHPDGRREQCPWPADDDAQLAVLQEAVGGYVEYVSPAWHALTNWDVYVNEEGLDMLPHNVVGSQLAGLDLRMYAPWCGPVVLAPRVGSSAAERERAREFFARLEAAAEYGARLPGWGVVIDARAS
ncbi:DUF3846 domain-containing protein [Deinococcus peraridilitoris]|uniref:DUF3846 domain-containing protein n=1 Tax=Deinococcus peraridilitoris (strain DSM 19664 / LMG 22246 / CIP 109416 / KR-200) TaxID=937777 RepID=L0A6A5_DEIPD|nr:hypothetical protein [Deinococcus peraridilitoris]AFZ69418.1 hypothetical protein Deipe_4027 [Deinococcus peraridilitoris DSM 19664]